MARVMLVDWEPEGLGSVARNRGLSVAWQVARGVLCLREARPGALRDPGPSPEGIVCIEWQRTCVLPAPLLSMTVARGVAEGVLRQSDSRTVIRRYYGFEDIMRSEWLQTRVLSGPCVLSTSLLCLTGDRPRKSSSPGDDPRPSLNLPEHLIGYRVARPGLVKQRLLVVVPFITSVVAPSDVELVGFFLPVNALGASVPMPHACDPLRNRDPFAERHRAMEAMRRGFA